MNARVVCPLIVGLVLVARRFGTWKSKTAIFALTIPMAAVAAEAAVYDLYGGTGTFAVLAGTGANGYARGQQFEPLTAKYPMATGSFQAVSMFTGLVAGETATAQLKVYVWNTNPTTSVAGAVLGQSAAIDLVPGNSMQEIKAVLSAPQSVSSGQVYFAVLYLSNISGPTGMAMNGLGDNTGGTNNDAWSSTSTAGGWEATPRTDREYAVVLDTFGTSSAERCIGPKDSTMFGVSAINPADIVFCDDYDNYCAANDPAGPWPGYPSTPDTTLCTDPCDGSETWLKAHWIKPYAGGPQFGVDNADPETSCGGVPGKNLEGWDGSTGWATLPFVAVQTGNNSSPTDPNRGAAYQVFDMTTAIGHKYPGADVINGTDANPLVLRFWTNDNASLSLQSSWGGPVHSVFYVELTLDSDRAPTDYAMSAETIPECVTVDRNWPIICQQDPDHVRPPGMPANCPSLSTVIHNSVAFGWLAALDTNPCNNENGYKPAMYHAATFDGLYWSPLISNQHPGNGGSFNYYMQQAMFEITIKTNTYDVKLIAPDCLEAGCSAGYEISTSTATLERQYTGPFNKIAMGVGMGCELDSASGDCKAGTTPTQNPWCWGWPRHIYVDRLVLVGGLGVDLDGACCLSDGECSVVRASECQPPDGLFQGSGSTCATAMCYPPVIYVDETATGTGDGMSWTNAFTQLQDALVAADTRASLGVEVRVAEGIYKPSALTDPGDPRTATFQLKSNVVLYGGFPSGGGDGTFGVRDPATYETILSGDIGTPDIDTDNSYHVVTSTETADETAVLDGFTVTKGYANGIGFDSQSGGGVLCMDSSSPRIANCTITGNTTHYGGGIFSDSQSSPTITNCTITGNEAFSGGGIHCLMDSSPTISDCSITGNTGGDDGGGIYCDWYAKPTIVNCTVTGNTASDYGGGISCELAKPTIVNCTVTGNTAKFGGGIYSFYEPEQTITNCIIAFNSSGIHSHGGESALTYNCVYGNREYDYSGGVDDPTGSNGNLSADPLFVDASPGTDEQWGTSDDEYGDLRLQTGSPCIDAADNYAVPPDTADLDGDGNTSEPIPYDLDGNLRFVDDLASVDTGQGTSPIVDMGAYEYVPPTYVYVDAGATGTGNGLSWADAFTELQDALVVAGECASQGAEIWVAQGIYKPSALADPGDPRTATFQLKSNVVLYGGFPTGGGTFGGRDPATYETILSGDIGTPDIDTDNSYHVVTADNTDETAILDGFTVTGGNGTGSGIENRFGGGIFCSNASPTIVNNTITGNRAYDHGSGIYCDFSNPTIANCTITGNTASRHGGGIYCDFSNPTIANCTITGNRANDHGGGIYCSNASPTIVNNTITGNRASLSAGGGIYCTYSSPTITNNTITGNSGTFGGGGIYCSNSSPTIVNNTIMGNNGGSLNSGGGIHCEDSSPIIANTIVVFNSSGLKMVQAYSLYLSHNCVYGNMAFNYSGLTDPTGSYGNMSADPLFVDASPGTDEQWGTSDDEYGDLRLQTGSPCIDAGDNNFVPAGITTDLDGTPRFVDDLAIVDTGQGTPPIVDIGAYERQYLPEGDNDGDGVINSTDQCPNTIPGANVDGDGCPAYIRFDFERDGDVDMTDFGVFTACATGPAIVGPPAGCTTEEFDRADADGDNDVDQSDFGVFQRCYSGQNNPGNPNCAS